MLIGIMDESKRKYLKNNIKFYPVDPLKPFMRISIIERETITRKRILLKKFSYSSSFPNLVSAFFILRVSFVSLPV